MGECERALFLLLPRTDGRGLARLEPGETKQHGQHTCQCKFLKGNKGMQNLVKCAIG